jgi:benzoylformate decarboxylase
VTQSEPQYTGADFFIDTLEEYGVSHVFGNPGTTELPIMDSLSQSDIEYILCLHEDIAVGAAAAYASTRRYHAEHDDSICPVGVANLHVTPGLAHGLGNLYAASVSGSPLLVTAGNHSLDFQHEDPILSGDLVTMAQQFTKWSAEVQDPSALPTMLRRAFRVALTPPTGPVFLSLPLDVTLSEAEFNPEPLGSIPTPGEGTRAQRSQAAELLVKSEEPVLVLGDQVARAGAVDAAVSLAEATGARVHTEMMASELNFPVDHAQWVSQLPPSGSVANSLLNVDTVALVGCTTNTTVTRHETPIVPEETTQIHIGNDGWELGKNQPADVAVLGDPKQTMGSIAAEVKDQIDIEEVNRRISAVESTKEQIEKKLDATRQEAEDGRASKDQLIEQLANVAPDAYIIDEAITTKPALLTRYPLQPEGYFANKGGGLGYGLPAAIGAAIAEQEQQTDRDVIGVIGDGSFMYYPQSLYTATRYGIDLTIVIPDNRNYRILKDNTIDLLGGTESDYDFVGMDFDPAVNLTTQASSQGAWSHTVENPEEIESALQDALSFDGPALLDVPVHD